MYIPGLGTHIVLWTSIVGTFSLTLYGKSDCAPAEKYTLCQNQWAPDPGEGFQTSTLLKSAGMSISWSTSYSWSENPNQVKSYQNVISDVAKGVQFKDIASVPTSWQWGYINKTSWTKANIAYDIWTGVLSSGYPASPASSYEMMIWLSRVGSWVQPLGTQIASNLYIEGHMWNLWKGYHRTWGVLTFVSADGELEDFHADLNAFFTYVINNQGVSSSQYIQGIQAGTEPFVGIASLVTTNYSVSIIKAALEPTRPPTKPLTSSGTSAAPLPNLLKWLFGKKLFPLLC